jgi:hypothetical protein
MRRISSQWTFFYKRVFPVLWFGVIACLILVELSASRRTPFEAVPILTAPVMMIIVGYAVFRRLILGLTDEVWDDGDALIVKNAGVEERVPLSNIMNVGYSMFTNPERITLTLREPGPLGKEVTFMPLSAGLSFRWLSRNPIIDELIARVDEARRRVR